MNHLYAVILGIIEGLTEFLPISSTGHMILAFPLLGIHDEQPPWRAFLYFIQIGAILAVVAYFARDLWRAILMRPTGGLREHLLAKLFVAFMPAAVVGLALDKWMEAHLERPVPVACALILGAFVMELIDRRFRGRGAVAIEQVSLRQAFLIGLAQCVSIIPGTSRSMATIMGGMLVGLTPQAATQFSFYLAIPTLLAAGAYKLFKHRQEIHVHEAGLLLTGTTVAFVVALAVVAWFLRYVAAHRFRPFAIYRVALGVLVLLAYRHLPHG